MKKDTGEFLGLPINHSDIKITSEYKIVVYEVDGETIFNINKDGELIGSDGEKVGQLKKEDMDKINFDVHK